MLVSLRADAADLQTNRNYMYVICIAMITHTCLSKLSFHFLAASRQKDTYWAPARPKSSVISSLSIHVMFFLCTRHIWSTPSLKLIGTFSLLSSLKIHLICSTRRPPPIFCCPIANFFPPSRATKNHASLSCQPTCRTQSIRAPTKNSKEQRKKLPQHRP